MPEDIRGSDAPKSIAGRRRLSARTDAEASGEVMPLSAGGFRSQSLPYVPYVRIEATGMRLEVRRSRFSRSSNLFPLASYVFFCERSRKKPSLQESAIQLPKGLSRTRLCRLISTRRTLSDKNRQLSRRPSKRLPDLLYALRIRSHG